MEGSLDLQGSNSDIIFRTIKDALKANIEAQTELQTLQKNYGEAMALLADAASLVDRVHVRLIAKNFAREGQRT